MTALRCLPSLATLLTLWHWARDVIFLNSIGKIGTMLLSTEQEHREHEQNNVDKASSSADAHSGPRNKNSFLVGSFVESQSPNVKEEP